MVNFKSLSKGQSHPPGVNHAFFYMQHFYNFYKQRRAEIDKKLSKSYAKLGIMYNWR